MKSHGSIRCPSCQGPLVPTHLHCHACDLTVSGTFTGNEFSTLGEDDLHLLRIFVMTEGRIRDMESALGVSYPTIKSRLAQLKAALAAGMQAAPSAGAAQNDSLVAPILQDLQSGRIHFEEAVARIRKVRFDEAMARIKQTQKGENP